MRRGGTWGGVVMMTLALMAGDAEAQRRDRAPVAYVGIAFMGADPVGELGSYFDAGYGGQFTGAVAVEPSGHPRLRGDFGFMVYGHERQRVCFAYPVGCRINVDMNTTNSILFGGIGPELALSTGRVQPYLNATFGFSYFATTSSLEGDYDHDDFASSTNFDDAVFAWRAGGGIRFRLAGGSKPISLDLGVEHHENGVADFLTEGDIQDNPDGSITLFPNRSEANLLAFRVGVTIGIPHGNDRGRDRKNPRDRRGRR